LKRLRIALEQGRALNGNAEMKIKKFI